MTKHRRAAKVDDNQREIVDALRSIPGVTVATNHDDILVGFLGKTRWYELKAENPYKKNGGGFKKGMVKPSQRDLMLTWTGHYRMVWTLDQILEDMGITS